MNFAISMNIRELGADPKFLALKKKIHSKNPKIILIQETMHAAYDTIFYFRKMYPSWYISTTEAKGLSGGLEVLWDPSWIKVKTYSCLAGILISAKIRGHKFPINILNMYAPYRDRMIFWDKILESEIFDLENLLIAGDLNLTLNMDEIWGSNRKKDTIAERLKNEFLKRNLVDVIPSQMRPTWENGTSDEAYVAKRLDRFLIHASVIHCMGMPFSSIENIIISDHRPIKLGWKERNFRNGYSFKFNSSLLDYQGFNDLIKISWSELTKNKSPSTLLMTFKDKMDHLRRIVKNWQYEKRQSNRKELKSI